MAKFNSINCLKQYLYSTLKQAAPQNMSYKKKITLNKTFFNSSICQKYSFPLKCLQIIAIFYFHLQNWMHCLYRNSTLNLLYFRTSCSTLHAISHKLEVMLNLFQYNLKFHWQKCTVSLKCPYTSSLLYFRAKLSADYAFKKEYNLEIWSILIKAIIWLLIVCSGFTMSLSKIST